MDINGQPPDLVAQQMEAMRRLEQFVQQAMSQAVAMLAPGYKPTVIFSFSGQPERDIIISAARLDDVLGALTAKMKAAGMSVPEAAASDEYQKIALLNLVAAIRRAVPFITGPGADTAKKMLGNAISVGRASESARKIVAAYLAEVPGMRGRHPGEIEAMLAAAEEGGAASLIAIHPNGGEA